MWKSVRNVHNTLQTQSKISYDTSQHTANCVHAFWNHKFVRNILCLIFVREWIAFVQEIICESRDCSEKLLISFNGRVENKFSLDFCCCASIYIYISYLEKSGFERKGKRKGGREGEFSALNFAKWELKWKYRIDTH